MPIPKSRTAPARPPLRAAVPDAVPAGLTFLEFVCGRVFGPPERRGRGQSHWPCPQCGHHSFHTRPPAPAFKDRFGCFRCGWFGDEYDAVRWAHPGHGYAARQAAVADLRAEYDALAPAAAQPGSGDDIPGPSSPPGTGTSGRAVCCRCRLREDGYDPASDEFEPATERAADALAGLLGPDPHGEEAGQRLTVAAAALRAAVEHQVHPLALAGQLEAREWIQRSDRDHLARCGDPDCDTIACRRARGWSEEQIRRGIDELMARAPQARAEQRAARGFAR